jgi:hypothetical protein
MISVHVDDDEAITLVKTVYANKLNATSRGARYSMNTRKRKFTQAFGRCAKVKGNPVEGSLVIAVYHFCLPRCDWDAPIKAVQDAAEQFLACRNDRVIRSALTFLTRPIKGSKKRQERKPFIEVSFFGYNEFDLAMQKAEEIGRWSHSCWQSKS